MPMPIEFATVEEAAEEFRQGRQIVLVDDEDRENEGDLALAGGENHSRGRSTSWPSTAAA